jgi:hypothetical protein
VIHPGVWLAVGASSSTFGVDCGNFVGEIKDNESFGLYGHAPTIGDIYSVFVKKRNITVFKNGEPLLDKYSTVPLYPTVSLGNSKKKHR